MDRTLKKCVYSEDAIIISVPSRDEHDLDTRAPTLRKIGAQH